MLMINSSQYNDEKDWIDCRINSLYQYLLYYGIDIPRDYIFLLSEAYTYYYVIACFDTANISHIPFAAASESNLEIKVLSALGFQVVTERLDDSADALKKMKELVDLQKKPILMHAIEYMFIRHTEVLEKLKINIRMQSIPILIGFNEKDDYILYWSSFGQNEAITVREKVEFDRLRSIECVPYSPDFWCTYTTSLSSDISLDNLYDLLHQSIKNVTLKMLYGTQIDNKAIQNLSATEAYIGLEAMVKMKKDLQNILDYLKNNSEDIENKKKFYMSILIMKIGLFKGSHYSFRKEFASALSKLAKETSDNNLFEIASHFEEIAISWRKLFVTINKMKLTKFDTEYMLDICNIFSLIYKKELKGFHELAVYYEILEV